MEPFSLAPIGKAAGSAIGKIVGAVAKNHWDRRSIAAAIKDIEPGPSPGALKAAISSLRPVDAKSIQKFIESAEFRSSAIRIVAEHLKAIKAKKAKKAIAKTGDEVRALMLLHAPELDTESIDRLADLIVAEVCAYAIRFLSNTHISRFLSPLAAGEVVRVAASQVLSFNDGLAVARAIERLADVDEFEQAMRRQITFNHAKMRLPHWGTLKYVPYSLLYVEPNLQAQEKAPSDRRDQSPVFVFKDVVEYALRFVILGDPGGGKSTLAFKAAYDFSRLESSSSTFGTTVPFVVVLKDFAAARQKKSKSVVEFIEGQCHAFYGVRPPQGAIEYLLTHGRAFVIFDGLDELVDVSLRRNIVDTIHSFVYRYPTAHMMVASRVVGYEEAPLDSDLFPVLKLGEFTQDQVHEYARKWFSQDEARPLGERERLARSFLHESEVASDLRENPLMLSLMCGIYSVENYIPRKRPDIYEKCATMLFERWDKERGIVVPLPFDSHVRSGLYTLAHWLYSRPDAQGGLKRSDLIRFMSSYLRSKRFDDDDEAENAATEFVEFCTGRAWVMTDVGADCNERLYGFTHRTFLEYFTSKQIVRINRTADSLHDLLQPRIVNAEWDVVAQLSLQIFDESAEDGANDVLELLLIEHDDAESEERRNVLSFLARSLAFIVPKPDLVRAIVERSFKAMVDELDPSSSEGDLLGSCLSSVMRATPELLDQIGAILRKLIDEFLREMHEPPERERLRSFIVHASDFVHRSNSYTFVSDDTYKFWRIFHSALLEEYQDFLRAGIDSNKCVEAYFLRRGEVGLRSYVERRGLKALFVGNSGAYNEVTIASQIFLQLIIDGLGSGSDSNWLNLDVWMQNGYLDQFFQILMETPLPWFDVNSGDVVIRFSLNQLGLEKIIKRGGAVAALGLLLVAYHLDCNAGRQYFSDRSSGGYKDFVSALSEVGYSGGEDPESVELYLRSNGIDAKCASFLGNWVRLKCRLTRVVILVGDEDEFFVSDQEDVM